MLPPLWPQTQRKAAGNGGRAGERRKRRKCREAKLRTLDSGPANPLPTILFALPDALADDLLKAGVVPRATMPASLAFLRSRLLLTISTILIGVLLGFLLLNCLLLFLLLGDGHGGLFGLFWVLSGVLFGRSASLG